MASLQSINAAWRAIYNAGPTEAPIATGRVPLKSLFARQLRRRLLARLLARLHGHQRGDRGFEAIKPPAVRVMRERPLVWADDVDALARGQRRACLDQRPASGLALIGNEQANVRRGRFGEASLPMLTPLICARFAAR